jgi:hypothetical protein
MSSIFAKNPLTMSMKRTNPAYLFHVTVFSGVFDTFCADSGANPWVRLWECSPDWTPTGKDACQASVGFRIHFRLCFLRFHVSRSRNSETSVVSSPDVLRECNLSKKEVYCRDATSVSLRISGRWGSRLHSIQ